MLQLDIYGVIDDYKDTFDLSRWNYIKPRYLAKVLALKNENLMYEDIIKTIPPEYKISMFTRLYSSMYRLCKKIYKSLLHSGILPKSIKKRIDRVVLLEK
jgi:hypothetical protein